MLSLWVDINNSQGPAVATAPALSKNLTRSIPILAESQPDKMWELPPILQQAMGKGHTPAGTHIIQLAQHDQVVDLISSQNHDSEEESKALGSNASDGRNQWHNTQGVCLVTQSYKMT